MEQEKKQDQTLEEAKLEGVTGGTDMPTLPHYKCPACNVSLQMLASINGIWQCPNCHSKYHVVDGVLTPVESWIPG